MRLLNSTTLEMREFLDNYGNPYAILSHTWGEEEVLFQDIDGLDSESIPRRIRDKLGFRKIMACCEQAKRDGFEWVWIDTCCIDKRSSAELSEAINSMFRWYQDCTVCYAYLADVAHGVDRETQMKELQESRWFTRGWTLQELVAPLNIEFYDNKWFTEGQKASIGTKSSLQREISVATRIPIRGLECRNSRRFSVAQRMSWAAKRETTRIEDQAYSLLGLFDVNMPLLYGERNRAFVRLQEEIIKTSTDETLFAWREEAIQTEPSALIAQTGLLAPSPSAFMGSGNFIRMFQYQRNIPFNVTSRGLQMEIILEDCSEVPGAEEIRRLYDKIDREVSIAVLNCMDEETQKMVGIVLRGSRNDRFLTRQGPHTVALVDTTYQPSQAMKTTIFARLLDPQLLAPFGAIEQRNLSLTLRFRNSLVKEAPSGFSITARWPKNLWQRSDDGSWITTIIDNSLCTDSDSNTSTGLRCQNDTITAESFVVFFGVLGTPIGRPCIWMKAETEKGVLGDHYQTFLREPVGNMSDRTTLVLNTGAIVSASCRPEYVKGEPYCALYISVDSDASPSRATTTLPLRRL